MVRRLLALLLCLGFFGMSEAGALAGCPGAHAAVEAQEVHGHHHHGPQAPTTHAKSCCPMSCCAPVAAQTVELKVGVAPIEPPLAAEPTARAALVAVIAPPPRRA